MKFMTYICVASSHGIDCVCKKVAKMYMQQSGSCFSNNENSVPFFDPHDIPGEQEVLLNDQFRKLLNDIDQWAENSCDVSPSILKCTDRLHFEIFGKYKTKYRLKKIQALHPYRRIINKAKQTVIDHQYSSVPGKNTSLCKNSDQMAILRKRKDKEGLISIKRMTKVVCFQH